MPQRVRALAHIARVEIISLLLCLVCSLQVQAQLAFPTANGLVTSQTDLTITPLANGDNLWATYFDVSNANSFAVLNVYVVVNETRLESTPAQWNNTAQQWELNGTNSSAANAAFTLPMNRTVTDLALSTGYGVTTNSSLPAIFVGPLAPHATTSFAYACNVTPSVNQLNFNFGYVYQASPLPASGPIVPELAPIEQAMTNYMGSHQFEAGTIALMHDSKLVLRQGYGWRDTNFTRVIHPDNLFRLASVSKTITAAAINKLVDAGLLSTSTKVYSLLGIQPWGGVLGDSRITNITVQNLLDHSGGWDRGTSPYGDVVFDTLEISSQMGLSYPAAPTNVISWVFSKPLDFTPGTTNVYSNFGYDVLGRVIEKISGKPYINYIQQDLFGSSVISNPLGFTNIIQSRSRPRDLAPWEIWYGDYSFMYQSEVDYPTNLYARAVDGANYYESYDSFGGMSASAIGLCNYLLSNWEAGHARVPGSSYNWNYLFYGSLPGVTSVLYQNITQSSTSTNGLEFAALFNQRDGDPNVNEEAYNAINNATTSVTSWPASGGGMIQWSVAATNVSKYGTNVTVPLWRFGSATLPVKISYATYGLNAGPSNYVSSSGVVSFGAGVTNMNVVVPILDDGVIGPPRQFTLELLSASGGAWLGTNLSSVVSIQESGSNFIVENTNDLGPGSLRYGVTYLPNNSTITFAPGLSGQTINLTSGEIAISQNLTIDASALASGVTVNGNHNSRIFNIAGGVAVTLNALILTNGYTISNNWGGAIFNAGTLALNYCTLAGNSGDSTVAGGAIANQGPLTVLGCTFSGNSAGFSGAIDNRSTCTLENSTFYGNIAFAGNGGAIDNPFSATLSVLQCTFSGNSASGVGGAIDNYLSQINITNAIVAGNPGSDIYNWSGSTIDAGGANIIPALVNGGTLVGGGTISTANPLLGPLANNGGLTQTMLPQTGSPAIDAGVTSLAASLTYDQRGPGYPRLVGDAVDIGAVEAGIVPFVFNTADAHYGSLRYAVTYSANNATITFANNLAGQAIVLTSGAIALNQNITINAGGLTGGIQVNGNHASQVFNVGSGVTAELDSLTITNGLVSSGYGGGIVCYGNLTLNDCKIVGNQAVSGYGGALAAGFGGTTINRTTVAGNQADNASGLYIQDEPLTLMDSTISGNSGVSGDAIRLDAVGATTTMVALNSTISGNSVSGGVGSALTIESGAGLGAVASLVNCTIANNADTAPGQPGAIYVVPGSGTTTLGIYNTIVSGNTSGGYPLDITGTADPGSAYNLVGNGGGLANGANGNIVGVYPQLEPLGNYGGETQTMPPLPGSPAVDAGSDSIAAGAGLTTDQRGPGFPRVVGSAVDIGAVELLIATTNPLLTGESRQTNGAFAFSFTNHPGASFTVFATTNLALPANAWSNLGQPVESPSGSGQFHFIDPSATNSASRFYRVRSP